MVWCVDVDGCVFPYMGPINVIIKMVYRIIVVHTAIHQYPYYLINSIHYRISGGVTYDSIIKVISKYDIGLPEATEISRFISALSFI